MTRIRDLLAEGPTISFEFFPPKSDEAMRELEKTLGELEPLNPSFVSVTYGAGGSTRERTRDIVTHIERDTTMTAMAHLTCVAHTRDDLTDIIEGYRDVGVENILALGGDPPVGLEDYPQELVHASDLVDLIRDIDDGFSIGVAAQPELHPRSVDRNSDRAFLADKLASSDFAITQFFFEPEPYLSMVAELAGFGCTKPILPGIMPVTNIGQVQRFAEMSGAEFPSALADRLAAVADDPAAVRAVGVELATELCAALLEAGVPGLHFYTLNRSTATREIAANLGLA